jgi:hypothetical protein
MYSIFETKDEFGTPRFFVTRGGDIVGDDHPNIESAREEVVRLHAQATASLAKDESRRTEIVEE